MEYGEQNPTTPTIQANANNINQEHLDCGITALGWCTGPSCQKFATIKVFIIILSTFAILQGTTESYFRISAKQAALDHDYDPTLVNWLLVAGGIFQALLALLVAFYAQKYHPISWLSGLFILQSVTALGAIIPSLTHYPFEQISAEPNNIPKICSVLQLLGIREEKPYALTTLVMLFVMQIGIALGSTALYAIGIAYIDNNSEPADSPALMGVILGTKIWGSQLGTAISLGVTATGVGWWLGWAIIIPLSLTVGILLSLFPRKLIKTVVKQAAHRILELTDSIPRLDRSSFIDDVNFIPTLRRLLTNKVLMFNLMSLVFIQLATVNYFLQEPNYLQSRFYLPTDESNGLTDEWLSRFLSYLLRPPVVGLCIFVAGLILSKLHPHARSLTSWNIGVGAAIAILFLLHVLIDCSQGTIAGTYRGKLSQPFCSRECICTSLIPFSPICPENSSQTYFSPCHAGCTKEVILNDISIYEGCTCAKDPDIPLSGIRATEGACNLSDCQLMWILFQILTVVEAALLGTTVVSKVIISLRVVLPQDKPLALALELFLTGIITYIPGKLIYDAISYHTCHYWSHNYEKCYLQETPIHGNILNGLSVIFIVIGIIFDICVFIFVEDVDCYPPSENDPGFDFPLEEINRRARYAAEITDEEDGSQINRETVPNSSTPLVTFESSPRRIIHATVEQSPGAANRTTTNIGNLENLDFRIQTPTDTTQPESSVRSISPDDSSERSDYTYIQELRNKMEHIQKRRLASRLPSHETDL